jgi:hypothetical protein
MQVPINTLPKDPEPKASFFLNSYDFSIYSLEDFINHYFFAKKFITNNKFLMFLLYI